MVLPARGSFSPRPQRPRRLPAPCSASSRLLASTGTHGSLALVVRALSLSGGTVVALAQVVFATQSCRSNRRRRSSADHRSPDLFSPPRPRPSLYRLRRSLSSIPSKSSSLSTAAETPRQRPASPDSRPSPPPGGGPSELAFLPLGARQVAGMDKARETREDVLLPTIGPAVGVNNLVEFWQRVNTALDYAEVNGHELLDGADSSDLEHVVSSTFESWTEEGGPSWAYTKGIHKGKPLGAVGLVKLADAGRKLLDLIREQLGVPLMQLPEESTLDITAFDWWGASSFAQTFFRPAASRQMADLLKRRGSNVAVEDFWALIFPNSTIVDDSGALIRSDAPVAERQPPKKAKEGATRNAKGQTQGKIVHQEQWKYAWFHAIAAIIVAETGPVPFKGLSTYYPTGRVKTRSIGEPLRSTDQWLFPSLGNEQLEELRRAVTSWLEDMVTKRSDADLRKQPKKSGPRWYSVAGLHWAQAQKFGWIFRSGNWGPWLAGVAREVSEAELERRSQPRAAKMLKLDPAPSDNVQAHHESPPFADAFLTDKRFIACATASTVSTLAAATWKRAQHAAVTEDLPHGHSESELPAHLQSFEAFIAHCKSVGRQAGCCVYDCPTATETIYTPFLPLPHPFDQTLWLCERHSRLYFVCAEIGMTYDHINFAHAQYTREGIAKYALSTHLRPFSPCTPGCGNGRVGAAVDTSPDAMLCVTHDAQEKKRLREEVARVDKLVAERGGLQHTSIEERIVRAGIVRFSTSNVCANAGDPAFPICRGAAFAHPMDSQHWLLPVIVNGRALCSSCYEGGRRWAAGPSVPGEMYWHCIKKFADTKRLFDEAIAEFETTPPSGWLNIVGTLGSVWPKEKYFTIYYLKTVLVRHAENVWRGARAESIKNGWTKGLEELMPQEL